MDQLSDLARSGPGKFAGAFSLEVAAHPQESPGFLLARCNGVAERHAADWGKPAVAGGFLL
jgi:hypothetical protein